MHFYFTNITVSSSFWKIIGFHTKKLFEIFIKIWSKMRIRNGKIFEFQIFCSVHKNVSYYIQESLQLCNYIVVKIAKTAESCRKIERSLHICVEFQFCVDYISNEFLNTIFWTFWCTLDKIFHDTIRSWTVGENWKKKVNFHSNIELSNKYY